jgi:uncharacterized phiE125 gp8 family phage protein
MATVQTAAPAVEPLALADAKAFLRIDTGDEDALIQSLILTSRLHVEVALGLALITQTWSCFFDRWPVAHGCYGAPLQPAGVAATFSDPRAWPLSKSDAFVLPIGPVQSVDAVRIYADDGTFVPLDVAGFTLDLASRPPRVVRRLNTASVHPGRRLNGIEIAITAGFGPDPIDVPAPIRQALLLLVAHWYENRDPANVGTPEARVPSAVSALLANYLPVRL